MKVALVKTRMYAPYAWEGGERMKVEAEKVVPTVTVVKAG